MSGSANAYNNNAIHCHMQQPTETKQKDQRLTLDSRWQNILFCQVLAQNKQYCRSQSSSCCQATHVAWTEMLILRPRFFMGASRQNLPFVVLVKSHETTHQSSQPTEFKYNPLLCYWFFTSSSRLTKWWPACRLL